MSVGRHRLLRRTGPPASRFCPSLWVGRFLPCRFLAEATGTDRPTEVLRSQRVAHVNIEPVRRGRGGWTNVEVWGAAQARWWPVGRVGVTAHEAASPAGRTTIARLPDHHAAGLVGTIGEKGGSRWRVGAEWPGGTGGR